MKLSLFAVSIAACISFPAQATDLYSYNSWSSLATDRVAHHEGDSLTILVYETASAENTANSSSQRDSRFDGHVAADGTWEESAALKLGSASGDTGSSGRSGGIIARISAVVDAELPNGDLHVSGAERLNIDGEETQIRVKGRVRSADISSDNTVLSNRLADAMIDYDGSGFVSRSARPGILTRIFNWLGLP